MASNLDSVHWISILPIKFMYENLMLSGFFIFDVIQLFNAQWEDIKNIQ